MNRFLRVSAFAFAICVFSIFVFEPFLGLSYVQAAPEFHSFKVQKPDGSDQSLSDYKGKVVLIVNVASRCGYTGQYDGLEQLYKKHQKNGLVVLGFPCNQFGSQEPGSNKEIQNFCKLNYGVTFPVMAKIDVNGATAHPLYKWLKASTPGPNRNKEIPWNFSKFLIDKNGTVISFYPPQVEPKDLEKDIEKALKN